VCNFQPMIDKYLKEDIDSSFYIIDESSIEIKEGKFLADIFDRIPNGRIDKRTTGIGATYMELNAQRDSIIVEPTKAIASTKAHKTSNALYVGSPTSLHPAKVNIENILAYHNNTSIPFKKIVVVADSLKKVISAIDGVYDSYFLMIDEVDSFQSESSYRPKLEMCIDYYFEFKDRALVSATMKNFSNPKIQEESLITITQPSSPQLITIVETNHPIVLTAQKIEQFIQENDGEYKLLIAFNSVTKIMQIIGLLSKEDRANCAVLCSEASKAKCKLDNKEYYEELINETLPNTVNFITSAYFTGVDIEDPCSIIMVTDKTTSHTLLNAERVKQVIGRSRKETNTIELIKSDGECQSEIINYDDIIDAAKRQLQAFECVASHYERNMLLSQSIDAIREGLINNSRKGINCKLTRKTIRQEYKIAYFNIDAFISEQTTQNELYCSSESLTEGLEKIGFDVENSIEKVKLSNEQLKILNEVREKVTETDNELILEAIEAIDKDAYDIYEAKGKKKKIFEQHEKLEHYLDKETIVEKLKELNLDKRDSREFNNYHMAVLYQAFDSEHPFKQQLNQEFVMNEKYTAQEITDKLKRVFNSLDAGINTPIDSETKAVKTLNLFFGTTRTSKQVNKVRTTVHRIDNDNPKEIKLKEHHLIPNKTDDWIFIWSEGRERRIMRHERNQNKVSEK